MAKFRSKAEYKKWLAQKYRRGGMRYQAGGINQPGPQMYGANTVPGVPSTAALTYQESDPEKLKALSEEIAAAKQDTTYIDEAMALSNQQDAQADAAMSTGVGLLEQGMEYHAGKTGLTPTEPEGPQTVQGALSAGLQKYRDVRHAQKVVKSADAFTASKDALARSKQAYDMTRRINMGEDAWRVAQGAKKAQEAVDSFQTTADLYKTGTMTMQGMKTAEEVRQMGQMGSSLKTGVELGKVADATRKTAEAGSAIKQGAEVVGGVAKVAGPQIVAAAAQYGGKAISKHYDDQKAHVWNEGEVTGDVLAGAGTAAGLAATASSLGYIGAANVWNPVGWAALAGAAIAGGIGLAKTSKAKKDLHKAQKKQTAEQHELISQRKSEALKSKEYSGYDFGKDIVRYGGARGIYRAGGPRKYQTGSFDASKTGLSKEQLANMAKYSASVLPEGYTPPTQGEIAPKDESWSNYLYNKAKDIEHFSLGTSSKHGAPTQLLSEITGIPSMLRLAQSWKMGTRKDATWKDRLHTATDTIGSIPGVGLTGKVVQGVGKVAGPVVRNVVKYGADVLGATKHSIPGRVLEKVHMGEVVSRRTGGARLPGGTMTPIPGSDAVEFTGASHEQGGIHMDENTEVENGETMDGVTMAKKGGPRDYFFSSHLKLGGKSFSQRHKDLLAKGGSQKDIDYLARMQEHAAGRNPDVVAMSGGPRKYQTGGGSRKGLIQEYDKHIESLFQSAKTKFTNPSDSPRDQTFNQELGEKRSKEVGEVAEWVQRYKDGRSMPEHFGLPDSYEEGLKEYINAAEEEQRQERGSKGNPKPGPFEYASGGPRKYQNAGFKWEDIYTPEQNQTMLDRGFVYDPQTGAYNKPEPVVEEEPEAQTPKTNQPPKTTYTSPFETKDDEKAFQDWANNLGYDTKGYGWGKASQGIWDQYGETYLSESGDSADTTPEEDAGTDMTTLQKAFETSGTIPDYATWAESWAKANPNAPVPDEETFNKMFTPVTDKTIRQSDLPVTDPLHPDYKKPSMDLTEEEQKALGRLYKDVPNLATAAGAAQLLPAAYAFLHKEEDQKLMGTPNRLKAPSLDRVSLNAERAANAADNRALNRFIETSGGGPANIINKMAAYRTKQTGDMKIAAAETRANTQISNQEAQMQMQVDAKNVQNAMIQDQINTKMIESQRVADENRKLMALDRAAQGLAGFAGDVLSYKSEQDLARATGSMGVYERNRLRQMLLGKINNRTGQPYTNAEIAEIFNISIEEPIASTDTDTKDKD